ncbi:MAG: AAA family ATPase [Propionibacteriaceae bacterium]|jgi:exonuclease SbcC|nr:AAA family ATPase [Propionibacteriaceae bacterium]
MRPVRLDIDGFASFREPATVDFEGTDYLAFIGPTGSGKSTVIDALIFALYGTAPRWGRAGAVQYALAPTSVYAAVRLVFDVGTARYQVARELRRSGVNVQQKTVSLERFHNPAQTTATTDEVTVVAYGPRDVTAAVERLLGLGFDDFTKAVVLPQGRFAEFLTAPPSNRQEILMKLLGAERYDAIMQAARSRSEAALAEVKIGETLIAELAGATPEAEVAAVARTRELAALATEASGLQAAVEAAHRQVADSVGVAGRYRDELGRLAGVTAPAGLDDWQTRAEMIGAALDRARAAESAASAAYATARTALEGADDRGELTRWRDAWADRAGLETRRPAAVESEQRAALAATMAVAAAERAEGEWQAAVRAESAANQVRDAAVAGLRELETRRAAVAEVRQPVGVGDLAQRLDAAESAYRSAEDDLAAAQAADDAARDRLGQAGDPVVVKQGLDTLTQLEQVRADLETRAAAAQRADTAADGAAAALAAEVARREAARVVADEANLRVTAADLRAHLALGDDCPVCAQAVTRLPGPVDLGEAGEAKARLEEAERAVTVADRAATAARLAAARAGDALDAVSTQADRLLVTLGELLRAGGEPTEGTALAAALGACSAGVSGEGTTRHPASDNDGEPGGGVPGSGPRGDRFSAHEVAEVLGDRRRTGDRGATDHVSPPLATSDVRRAIWWQDIIPPCRVSLEAQAQELAAAQAAAGSARTALVAARQTRAQALAARDALRAEAETAWPTLRAARQGVLLYGAPTTETSLAQAWADLAGWAAAELARLEATDRPAARARAAAATSEFTVAETAQRTRATERVRAAEASTAAVAEAARRAADLAQADTRLGEVIRGLASAPSADEVRDRLRELDALTATERAALATFTSTRRDRERAEAAEREFAVGQRAYADQLRAARDALIPLGVPPLDPMSLAAGWRGLLAWVDRTRPAAEARLADATAALTGAEAAVAAAGRALVAAVTAHGVTVAGAAQVGTALAEATARATDRLAQVRADRARAHELAATNAAATERAQVAGLLAGHLGARNFQRWLANSALDVLVNSASESLLELSGGQFSLTHEAGEFWVIDHTDADSRRSVRTLSGGETFQASLALALALSAELSTLTPGSPRLDSLFLDEGFGSLDPDSLELVAATLERLAQGDRLVGIVTHVQALADRVPTRYRVSRTSRTSVVVRE